MTEEQRQEKNRERRRLIRGRKIVTKQRKHQGTWIRQLYYPDLTIIGYISTIYKARNPGYINDNTIILDPSIEILIGIQTNQSEFSISIYTISKARNVSFVRPSESRHINRNSNRNSDK